MTLISEEYKNLNTFLHSQNKNYGGKGWKRTEQVYTKFIKPYNLSTVLDYGCGKGTLARDLSKVFGITVQGYDPCYEQFETYPKDQVFDGVICNDMLEHVEPEFLDNVLQDILSLGKVFHLEIGLTKSNKYLADGRNNHLIVQPSSWWKETLERNGFVILEILEDWVKHEKLMGFYTVICGKK